MSQRLRTSIRKDGKSKGVMIRKTNATKNNPSMVKTLFQMAYQQHIRNKNGTSKG